MNDDTGDTTPTGASAGVPAGSTAVTPAGPRVRGGALRGWDAGAALTLVALAVLALVSEDVSRVPGSAGPALGAFVGVWIGAVRPVLAARVAARDPLGAGGRGGSEHQARAGHPAPSDRPGPRALVAAALVVLVAGALTAASPQLATAQAFLMPVLWALLPTVRSAIVGNVALVAAVTGGFVLALGPTAETVRTAATSELLSLAFSIALGLWITSIAHAGAERARLLAELEDAQGELAARARDVGTSAERERLSRDLHDTVAQSLTGVVLLAQQARSALVAGDVTTAGERLDVVEEAAREALTETRALVAATASPGPTATDLGTTLQRLGARFARETGIDVDVRVELAAGAAGALAREHEVVVVRCAQEALSNVRRHSGSASARVVLRRDGDDAVLTVVDGGTGFDPALARDGFGLEGLAERLALAGGSLDLSSGAGGTTLTARLPLAAVTS
ncbi:signal transduction histidine kinase [Frigoribacterium sp. PvP120]|uniref:sensor histidine kinase n=1 Tax=unclassified Frigoribacterium TaxID=2627005 RepID=UPI001AE53142|nr:sensor histidine kinase [Frigoribacterium sp. PvP121]MBP1240410.1 signal transduction histidine kinase [Frigoribacterium sp. PvP121]